MPYCTQLIYFETARYELGMKPLLLQNQDTLHTVIFKADPVQNAELISIEWIWKYLADAPNLRVLELSSVIVSDYEGSKFGLVCRNLTHLSLINAKLIERPKSETGDHFVNLKSLVLDQTYFPRIEQLELLQLCPNLELLTWKSRTGSFPLANFFSYLRLDHQQHLAQLTKLDLSTSKIQDESFAQVIELIPQLTRLHVAKTLFGSIATRVLLQGRGPHMQVINVLDCSDVTKVESQALLMGCPALKEFYAPVVSALGMLGSKWVCTGLEVLDICIADIDQLPSPSYPRHRAVYTQLSVLAKLQVLRLGDLGFASVPDRRIAIVPGYIEPRSASPQDRQQQNHQLKYVLDMRLESGLGLLSTLTKLRELNVVKLHAAMEFADLQWIVQNWRRLRVVVGSVHPQEQQRDLSNDFLREFIPGLHTFLNTQEQKMWGQLESMK
ncbi:hypothetical protein BG004_006279 [Podila humilis]|nr:hypothetical protein BG004_006279 [Podila humilis]